jgi:hypothetical protein
MSAAPVPGSAFWVPEIWFEPEIVGCLRQSTPTVLFVVLQSRRVTPLVDVVLDLFHVSLRDAEGREHLRAVRFEIGSLGARCTVDLEQSLDPIAGPAVDVHDVTVLGCLHGRDAVSGIELVEPVAFWCDGEDRVYLHPAPQDLARDHPCWGAATTSDRRLSTD